MNVKKTYIQKKIMTLSIRPDSVAFDVRTDRAGVAKHGGITALFLGCQVNPDLWVPVKKLIWDESGYRMGCVAGVKQAIASSRLWQNYFGLSPIDRITITSSIPPVYACRMPLDRPQEMPVNLPDLGLRADLDDPIAYVARSGGYRQKDDLDVFPELEPDRDGCYRFFFGLSGLHLLADERWLKDTVRAGDRLIVQGRGAIHQPTGNPIGSVPGYIQALFTEHPPNVTLQIEQVNDAFFTKRKLLCSATCRDFTPFTSALYLPIGDLDGNR